MDSKPKRTSSSWAARGSIETSGACNLNGSGCNATNKTNGNSGNKNLNWGTGFDTLLGYADNEALNADTGEDRLKGGSADDMTNGVFDTQTDAFVFGNGFGSDVIQNYDFDQDVVHLAAATNITDFADLDANHLTQVGFNALIIDCVTTITIFNRNESSFDADDCNSLYEALSLQPLTSTRDLLRCFFSACHREPT